MRPERDAAEEQVDQRSPWHRSSPTKRVLRYEARFRQIGIYSPNGQQYTPQDRVSRLLTTKKHEKAPDSAGRYHESWAQAHPGWLRRPLQHQRSADDPVLHLLLYVRSSVVGDLCWQAGDQQARGFLICGLPVVQR